MKIINLINNILFRQYELRVEDYSFNKTSLQCFITFRLRLSRCKLKVPLNEVITNENYINKIHPYDCYIIGIISKLIFAKIIPENQSLLKIKHNNEKVKPCLHFIGINYKNNLFTFTVANSTTRYNLTIRNILSNLFIIRGLSSTDSLKLGFVITNSLIYEEGCC